MDNSLENLLNSRMCDMLNIEALEIAQAAEHTWVDAVKILMKKCPGILQQDNIREYLAAREGYKAGAYLLRIQLEDEIKEYVNKYPEEQVFTKKLYKLMKYEPTESHPEAYNIALKKFNTHKEKRESYEKWLMGQKNFTDARTLINDALQELEVLGYSEIRASAWRKEIITVCEREAYARFAFSRTLKHWRERFGESKAKYNNTHEDVLQTLKEINEGRIFTRTERAAMYKKLAMYKKWRKENFSDRALLEEKAAEAGRIAGTKKVFGKAFEEHKERAVEEFMKRCPRNLTGTVEIYSNLRAECMNEHVEVAKKQIDDWFEAWADEWKRPTFAQRQREFKWLVEGLTWTRTKKCRQYYEAKCKEAGISF